MRIPATLLLAAALTGCVAIERIESGERMVGSRMMITLEGPWNQVNESALDPATVAALGPALGQAQTWTMEGLTVDQLLLYSGIRDGEIIHLASPVAGSQRKDFVFRAAMQPHEIATMFEAMLTRDGSSFTLVRLGPAMFGGIKGFQFEYSVTRKLDKVVLTGMGYGAVSNREFIEDDVVLSGIGYGAVSKGELFAILYLAPRLAFFPRHASRVERIARSARVKE